MSYYERHVFFCCNQRDNGKNCCNDHGASAIRDYAKDKVKELSLRTLIQVTKIRKGAGTNWKNLAEYATCG